MCNVCADSMPVSVAVTPTSQVRPTQPVQPVSPQTQQQQPSGQSNNVMLSTRCIKHHQSSDVHIHTYRNANFPHKRKFPRFSL